MDETPKTAETTAAPFQNTSKKNLAIAAVTITTLSIAFLLVTNVMVNSASVVYVPAVQTQTKVVQSDAMFYISIGNDIVFESDELQSTDAQAECEAVAYNGANMWKQVVCVFEGQEIYNDIFVAG